MRENLPFSANEPPKIRPSWRGIRKAWRFNSCPVPGWMHREFLLFCPRQQRQSQRRSYQCSTMSTCDFMRERCWEEIEGAEKRNGLTPRGTPLTRVLEWWVVAAYNNVPHNSSQSNSRGTEGEGLWGSAAAKGVIAFVSSLINVVVVASFFVLVAKSQRKSVHLFMVIILRIFLRIHSFLAWVALPDIFPFCGGALWNWLLPRFRHSNSTLFSSSSFPLIWSPAAAAAERERSASTMIMVIPLDDDDRRAMDGWRDHDDMAIIEVALSSDEQRLESLWRIHHHVHLWS